MEEIHKGKLQIISLTWISSVRDIEIENIIGKFDFFLLFYSIDLGFYEFVFNEVFLFKNCFCCKYT